MADPPSEQLSSLYANLSLDQEEATILQISDSISSSFSQPFGLVGKLFLQRSIPSTEIYRLFKNLWTPKKNMLCKSLGENIFLFLFDSESDFKWVLKGEPWAFDRHLMALTVVDTKAVPSCITPRFTPFWIQIHDLPIGLLNLQFAHLAGNQIGRFLEAEPDSDGSFIGRFLRVRVELDITKPLRRVLKINQRGVDLVAVLEFLTRMTTLSSGLPNSSSESRIA